VKAGSFRESVRVPEDLPQSPFPEVREPRVRHSRQCPPGPGLLIVEWQSGRKERKVKETGKREMYAQPMEIIERMVCQHAFVNVGRHLNGGVYEEDLLLAQIRCRRG